MKKMTYYTYIFLFISLTAIVSSCRNTTRVSGHGNITSVYDSDEEIRKHMGELNTSITKTNEKIAEKDAFIKYQETMQASLGENNKYLKEKIGNKREEVSKILREIYDDTNKGNKAYAAHCNSCGKIVAITYDKFYEMASRYNTGWTRHDSYKWFLWAKWDHKTKSSDCHTCPQCMIEEKMRQFQKSISENHDKIAEIEAKLVKKRSNFEEKQDLLQEQTESVKNLQGALASEDKLRNEKAQAIEEKLEAQRIVAEKKAENERLKKEKKEGERQKDELKNNNKAQVLNMVKSMLEYNVPIEEIMKATGLSRQEIEQINNNN